MRDEELAAILREDLSALADAYQDDGFARNLRSRIEARKRVRAGILGIVGIFGAGVAAAQFNRLFESASQSMMIQGLSWQGSGYSSAIMASLIIATAVIATAIVLQREG